MYKRKENKSLYWPAKEIRVLKCTHVNEKRNWEYGNKGLNHIQKLLWYLHIAFSGHGQHTYLQEDGVNLISFVLH